MLAMTLALPPAEVRGYMSHAETPEGLHRALDYAIERGMNHFEFGAVGTAEDALAAAETLEPLCAKARSAGIDTYFWLRELNTENRAQPLDPASPEGAAFWAERKGKVRAALRAIPSASGVILSLASTPTEPWDASDPSPFWQGKSQPERVRFIAGQFRDVVSGELGRKMYIRDFNHGADELRWLVEGLRGFPGAAMHSKWVPQDWQLFYPPSASLGAYGSTPQVIEADLGAEYWGESVVPVWMVEYIRDRWRECRRRGALGVVGRIDRWENSSLGTPSEVNAYALSVYLREPDADPEAVTAGFLQSRYGLEPGSRASRALIEIYRRTMDQAKAQWYTLGFWGPKSQSMIPDTVLSIESAWRGRANAIWDPAWRLRTSRFLAGGAEIRAAALAEKDRAVAIASLNLAQFQEAQGALRPADAEDWLWRLEFSRDLAQARRDMMDAVWTLKCAESHGSFGREEIERRVRAFLASASALGRPGPSQEFRKRMVSRSAELAADIRKRMDRLP